MQLTRTNQKVRLAMWYDILAILGTAGILAMLVIIAGVVGSVVNR